MNEELMFQLATDVAYSQREGVFGDKTYKIGGKKHVLTFIEQQKFLTKQIQAFMHNPSVALSEKASLQAFSGSSDLPKLTSSVFNVNALTKEWDLGWQNAFRGIKLSQGELSWEIATVDSGISFKLIPEGGKVEYGNIAGEKVTAEIAKYGAGLGVTWETIQGRKLYKFVRIMEDARAALYDLWGNVHYGLLAAASTSNQTAYQGAGTDRVIDRDILTINTGAYACAALNKDKGYGNMARASFLLYAQPNLKARLDAAVSATTGEMKVSTGMGSVIMNNVRPIYTFNHNVLANKGLLVLPGNKIQNAVYLNELGFSRQEMESLNELRTYWTAFGAVVADTDQVFELSFA